MGVPIWSTILVSFHTHAKMLRPRPLSEHPISPPQASTFCTSTFGLLEALLPFLPPLFTQITQRVRARKGFFPIYFPELQA